jgi:uncharacterized protein (DUF3084 family)
MHKNVIKNIALILLLGITAFSMVRYVSELKARFRLQDSLTQAQGEVAVLTQEKQNLLQELGKEKESNQQLSARNVKLKAHAKAGKVKMTRLFQDNFRIQNKLEDVSAKFAVLKAENRALIDSRKRVYLQNEEFKVKLSSIVELRKVIRELKKIKHNVFDWSLEGNQGYLIKDGQSTLKKKIKIEIVPASYKSL